MVNEYREQVTRLIPEAEVFLAGSASVESLDSEDIDLVVLVPKVAEAAAVLRRLYPPLYEEQWRDDWAAFRDPGPPQVDLVVTRPGTKGDAHHRRVWTVLAQRPDLLAEYRALKTDRTDYEARKAAFFERVVALMQQRR